MDERVIKISINRPGGTASANAKSYRISHLPAKWLESMGFGEDDRLGVLSFDGVKIVLTKKTPD